MCTLHFIRNGTPRFGISSQNSNGTSYGTNYEVWTAYNSNKSDVNWTANSLLASGVKTRNICIEITNSGSPSNSNEINNWNGPIYMQYATTNNISLCNGGGKVLIGGISSDYRLNVSGDIIATGWIRSSGAVGWYSQSYGGGIYMTDTTYVRVYNNKSFYVSGNIVATGGITAKQASDKNLKAILKRPDYQEMILRLGMAEAYNYNSIATSRKEGNVREGWHIGIMYQNAKEVLPQITGLCDDGYGYVNYHDTDLTGLMIGAIQMNILAQKTTEQRLEEALLRIETLEGILEVNGLLNRNHIGI